jgi:hypothetical protein
MITPSPKDSSAKTKHPASPLMRLPTELQLEIIDNLHRIGADDKQYGALSVWSLRISNRHFYNLISKPNHADLLALERTQHIQINRLYTCSECVRIRPEEKFDIVMPWKDGDHGQKYAYARCCDECQPWRIAAKILLKDIRF